MLHLVYLHRLTSSGVILQGGGGIMLLLHLLLSSSFYSNPGPQTSRPSCHFLDLYENASSFFKAEKKTSAHFCLVASTDPRITYREMKTKGTTDSTKKKKKNVINRSYCTQHRRMRRGSSRMWDPLSRGRGGLLSFGLTQAVKFGQRVGLFRLSSEAASRRSGCLIHHWP